ncbi:retrovirus-related Pol polyprotein from transposon 297 [Trichonephila clavipes]|nr:retrovirus-related Pol polyprotein from transposon 297 [Trichonephila clavipes]
MLRHYMKERGLVMGQVDRSQENSKDLGKPGVRFRLKVVNQIRESEHRDQKRPTPEPKQGIKRAIPFSISSRNYKYRRPNNPSQGSQSIAGPSHLRNARQGKPPTEGSKNDMTGQYDNSRETRTTTSSTNRAAERRPVLSKQVTADPDLTCPVFAHWSVRAVLKQPDASNVLHPIAYHSRTLRDYEKSYAITELECLAIIDALDKFHFYLHGQKFIIHSDHAVLVWLKNVKNLRGRLFRWSIKLSMYDYEIKYLKGSTNIEADMLSRHPVAHHLQHSSHLLDINEIKTHQKNDNLCGPKYHEIKDVIVIKKKNLHKIVLFHFH